VTLLSRHISDVERPKPQSKAPPNTQITNVHNSVAGMQCAA